MSIQKNNFPTKVLVCIATVIMIVVNTLATIGIINGVTTASISDSYPTLFTPAGITFSIWSLIYLSLIAFTIYQFLPRTQQYSEKQETIIQKVRILYILSCLINSVWIFVWQYNSMIAAMILMVALLTNLIRIALLLSQETFSKKQTFFLKLPFYLYLGWITVATVANAAVLLVSLGWNGGILSPTTWTIIILIVAALIGLTTILHLNSTAYGAVLIWAYFGIFTQHNSTSGFNGKYPIIITTVLICMALFLSAIIFTLFRQYKKKKL